MSSTPLLRSFTCPVCGKLAMAGRRGPLPRRCAACRRYRVLPERAAGRTTCSTCGTEITVPGRRGRLPTLCPGCRRESKNSGRRHYADLTPYTADELAELVSKGFWRR